MTSHMVTAEGYGPERVCEPPRQLTTAESSLIGAMLAHAGLEKLRSQVAATTVSAECLCGCRTVTLIVNRAAVSARPVSRRVLLPAWATDSDGMELLVQLHITRDGYLAELEVLRGDGRPVATLPSAATLHWDTTNDD